MRYRRLRTGNMVPLDGGVVDPVPGNGRGQKMGTVDVEERRTVRKPALRHVLPVAGAGFVLLCLPHLDLGHSMVLAVLQAVLPVMCFAALVPCVYLAIRRAWVSLVVLVLCLATAMAPALNPVAAGCVRDESLSLLSLNAGRGHADPAGIAAAITESDAEVLVFLEASEPMIQAVAEVMGEWKFTNRTGPVVSGGAVDTVILSRYPLHGEEPAALQSAGALFDVPVAVIDHPRAGKVRVAGIHPVPPTHGVASWAQTLEAVRTWSRENTGMPLVLTGDFNATRAHPGFRTLASGFSEAAPSVGRIAIGTWPANSAVPAFAAIDHVLVRGLAAAGSVPLVVAGTDHHGIVARLASCR